jgi:hypothetical protein
LIVQQRDGDGLRLRDIDGMAARCLDDGRAGAARPFALCVGRDDVIVGGDHMPGRPRLPGRLRNLRLESRRRHGHLRDGKEGGIGGRQILREGAGKDRRIEEEEAVLRWLHGRRAAAFDHAEQRFACVRHEGRDVDEARDILRFAGFGDDDAAIGMADKDRRPVLPREHALRGGNILGKSRQRVLNDAYREAAFGQDVGNTSPARPVGPGAMDEDDILDRRRLRLRGARQRE